MEAWQVLVVDDEEDVHAVTRLAFKRKSWRNRPFELLHASSAAEARKLLEVPEKAASIQVAIVDVVMEAPDAGLVLCRDIRRTCPTSLRIILRTGQPGQAPADAILTDYDIDCYLAKSEVTAEGLFSSVCASLRSSQDISTLYALGKQIQNFTRALRRVSTIDDLLVFMYEGLRFLESKYGARLAFHYDLSQAKRMLAALSALEPEERSSGYTPAPTQAQVQTRLLDAFAAGTIKELDLYPGPEFGLAGNTFVFPFTVREDETTTPVHGALLATLDPDNTQPKLLADFQADVLLFVENWRIAYGSLLLQERAKREALLREQMHRTRLESIAQMVAGVAHEVSTPLGVANTANSMVTSLVQRILSLPTDSPDLPELVADLSSTSNLLSKNLLRAHNLVQSFKQLSVGQLSDRRVVTDLRTVVSDCIESMTPEMRRSKVEPKVQSPEAPLQWDGYPGHLSQVIVNLIQNVIRYAYPRGTGGPIEFRLSALNDNNRGIQNGFRIEVEDLGAGIPEKLRPRLFEPFATSALGNGGTGLGLAVSRNIVHDLLGGRIDVSSTTGKGTTFIIDLPRIVANPTNAAGVSP